MSRSRPLASFERAQLLTSESSPFNLVVSLGIEGSVDRKRLRRALDGLQRCHPLLAARLVGKPGDASFELDSVPPIPLRVRRTGEATWIDTVEEELSTGFDRAEGPLVRCSLIESDGSAGRSEVILTFHHAIVDATSAGRIIHELLDHCGAETEPPDRAIGTPPGLPPRADDLFPSRYRGVSRVWPACRFLAREMASEISYRWRTRAHRARPHALEPGERAGCRILPIAFSETDTTSLVRATRERGLTLNSALNAALLLAVVRRRYPGTNLPHRYFVFPNLRPYLDPRLPDESDGSYLTTIRLTVRTSEQRDVWDLAEEIQQQVLRADKLGAKFLAALFSAMSMKMILGQSGYRMGTIGMSYTGARPFELQHGGLRLAEIHAFVSNLPIGSEYTAQARIFRGKLWLDILYLDVDMDESEARTIAEQARSILLPSTSKGAES